MAQFLSTYVGRSAVAMFVALLAGCASIRMPDLARPGPAGYQRAAALQFDPYPLDDVAPAVAGGRPREYQRPEPETERGQKYAPRPAAMQPVPWPALTASVPAATAPAAPYQYAPSVQAAPVYSSRPPY